MATLNEIENFLNIEIGDKRFRPGKKYADKNRYYYYNELYYIIELTQNKWMICSDNRETRQLLRDYAWCYSHGYASTSIERKLKCYHQIYLNYEAARPNNTSGKQGVSSKMIKHVPYWVARIQDNDGNEIIKSFNINKLGDDEAKRQAIEQRLAWEVLYDYRGE